jgi:type I restriction enzyme M protein
MVDPQLGDKVMDPACGTGGFLTCTIEHKRASYVKTPEDEQILQASLFGVEKKPLPHLLATTNMILHGIEVPSQIRHDNTLARPLHRLGAEGPGGLHRGQPALRRHGRGRHRDQLPGRLPHRETADLFLVLIMHLLKDGGRAAVVLPDGFLFGEGVKSRIKEKLLTECNLHTIVRLPNGVFNPYTGIKTNLLFFTKGQPTRDVWFYEHPYPAGREELQQDASRSASRSSRPRRPGGAARPTASGRRRVHPHAGPEASHDPVELLAEFRRLQTEAQDIRDQLKAILGAALLARSEADA